MTAPPPDPLDRPATIDRVHLVLEAAGVPASARARVLAMASRTPSAVEWRRFLGSALLLLGAGLVLSGIVSFFAFNWAALGTFAKLGLIGSVMSACALGAVRQPDTLVARVLLFAAAVLVGALLAVFGQAYQTGADPWGLFGVWALLILPWAIAACFTPLWLLVVVLVDVAHGLYVGQVLQGPRWDVTLVLGVVGVHVLAVMAWETQYARRDPWLRDYWAPRVLVGTALLLLLAPSLMILVFPGSGNALGGVSLVALTFLVVTTGTFYRLVRPDTFMLTAAAGTVMALVTTLLGRLLIHTLNLGLLGMMLMTGVIVLEVTLVVSWLRGQAKDDAGPLARTALTAAGHGDLPWYLRVLVGAAAWVGALFLLGTVLGIISLAIGQRVDAVAMVLGLALMPAGVSLRRKGGGELLWQCALVCVITGQLLLLGGLGAISESLTLTALTGMASSGLLIATFDDGVYRFGATLAIIGSLLVMAFDVRLPYTLGLVTALAACLPVLIWRTDPGLRLRHAQLDPVAWACATAACGLLALQATLDAVTGTAGYSPAFIQLLLPRAWPLTVVFVALLVWLALQVVRDHDSTPSAPVPLAAIAATVALGALTLSTPAVCGALLCVVLGFDRRRPGLVALAAAFLVGFLGLYYYSLSLSLLQKSLVLVASGAVCLGVVVFLRHQAPEADA